MFGVVALLLATVGMAALYVLRIGFLDRWSIPEHALTLVAVSLAIVQLRSKNSRWPRISRGAAIVALIVSAVFTVMMETATHYPSDRPLGPEIGSNLDAIVRGPNRPNGPSSSSAPSKATWTSAIDGRDVVLSRPGSRRATLLICFRGFW